ncbi:MAG: ribonuclease III [Dehalococcoides mccartyi]|nr:MAG: ribonuclease III [Dehalococcoides mccartyi]
MYLPNGIILSEMLDLTELENSLGVKFEQPSLLEQALIHTSWVNENPNHPSGSNERMEFLGDAVLGVIFADRLYHDFPDIQEGDLTRFRSLLVRRESLVRVALGINLGKYLYLGRGEDVSKGRFKPANLAGAFEAVLAAIYIDKGMDVTREVIFRLFKTEMERVQTLSSNIDYKSRLQELIQAQLQLTPRYRITNFSGPEHNRLFIAEVYAEDRVFAEGSGRSKKEAETNAAKVALQQFENSFTDEDNI